MKLLTLMLVMFVVLIPAATADCVKPSDVVSEDVVWCRANYSISQEVRIESNVEVDCDFSVISCSSPLSNGIGLVGVENVSLNSCVIQNCQNGMYLKHADNIEITNSFLIGNKIGVAVEDSSNPILSGNSFVNNSNSFYSIRSLLDKEMLLEANSFDTEPVIQEFVAEGEPEVAAEEQPETAEPIELREVMDVEITTETMRTILLDVIESESAGLDNQEIQERVDMLVEQYFLISRDSLILRRNIVYNGSETLISIEISPRANLTNVSYYEMIPKCVAEYVAEIIFINKDYKVIRSDPLLAWHFANLNEPTEISYIVKKKLPEDCVKLLIGIGIVKAEGEEVWKVVVAIILIPVIALVVIYFRRPRK